MKKIEYICAILILATTIGIQISQSQVEDNNNKIIQNQNTLNNFLIGALMDQNAYYHGLNELSFYNLGISYNLNNAVDDCSLSKDKAKNLCEDFLNKKIDQKEFLRSNALLHFEQYQKYMDEYDNQTQQIEKNKLEVSNRIWNKLSSLFLTIQVVSSLFIIFIGKDKMGINKQKN